MMAQNKRPIKMFTYDIEAEHWNRFRLGGIYDGKTYYEYDNIDIFYHKFIDIMDTEKECMPVFYAHNAGKYDMRFLIKQLARDFTIKILPISNSLSSVKVYRKRKKIGEFRDSYHILPSSLDMLTKEFDVTRKLHTINVKHLERYRDEDISPYLKTDCIGLYEVLEKRQKMTGKNLRLTVASESKAEWIAGNKGTVNDERGLRISVKYDDFVRKSYHGGRTEVFKRYGRNLFYYDVNSMYPSVMKNRPYPAGKIFHTKKFWKDRLGIYEATVHVPYMRYPLLCTKSKDDKLLFPIGTFDGVFTSAELLEAQKYGVRFKIKTGMVWTDSCYPFTDYVNHWHTEKKKAKKNGDKAREYIAKLHLNSLYGKLGQRRFHRHVKQGLASWMKDKDAYCLHEEMDLWSYDVADKTPFTYVHLGSFVTAYSRILLHQGMMEVDNNGGEVFYCDTDSITTDVHIKSGDNLGEWELENEIREGIFILPKLYALSLQDGSVVIHSKGLDAKRLKWSYFEKALKGDLSKLQERRHQLVGIFASARRGLDILDTIISKRSVKHIYDKRIMTDDINTEPISL